MFSKLFLAITAVAVVVNAQDTDVPPCVLACVVPAATINNCEYTDPSCICASAQFVADTTACLTAHCTADDIAAALTLQTSQCSAAGIIPTGTATAPNSIPFTLASTSTDASASASGSTSAPAGSTTSAPATTTRTTPAGSTTRASSAPASSTAAAASTSSAAASGLIAQSGAGAVIGAVLAGVLAF